MDMDRALVVVRSEDDRSMLSEAASLAEGVDAELILLNFISREEFQQHLEMLNEIESVEHMNQGDPTEGELAAEMGEDLCKETLSATGVEIDVKVIGAVPDTDPDQTILELAETNNCDHIFITGQERSPVGKALFGDVVQSVIRGTEGYVTVSIQP
jgi:nucleotide-binding universal stress UspA family protein